MNNETPIPGMPPAPVAPGDEAAPGSPSSGEAVCPDCNGTGQRNGTPCPTCEGTGKIIQGIGGG
jgi:RecJ-like exonuclease